MGMTLYDQATKCVTGSWDKTLVNWDLSCGIKTSEVHSAHGSNITSVRAFESMILSSSFDGTLRLWDTRTRNLSPVNTFEHAHGQTKNGTVADWVFDSTWHWDGNSIFGGRRSGLIERWDVRQPGTVLQSIKNPNSEIMCMNMIPRTNTLAFGSRHALRVWSLTENITTAASRRAPNPTLFPFPSDCMSSIGFVNDKT